MGVPPVTFAPGQDADSLGLDGTETFTIEINNDVKPRQQIKVTATKSTPTPTPTPTLRESANKASGTPANTALKSRPYSPSSKPATPPVKKTSPPRLIPSTPSDNIHPMLPAPITFTTATRIDTPVEVDYYRNGGILHGATQHGNGVSYSARVEDVRCTATHSMQQQVILRVLGCFLNLLDRVANA